MQNLLDFFLKYYHWLLFLILEIISGVLLFRYNSYQGSVWFSSANGVAGKVYEWRSAVTQFFSLSERNAILEQRNVELEQQLEVLRGKVADLTIDTTVTKGAVAETSQLDSYALIGAKVIANAIDSRDNLMTIDRGRADGVNADMGVVCGTGLVGVVYMASQHYAVVIPILNQRSRISCSVRGREFFGYLNWNGGDPTVAFVDDIPRHAKFLKGEWVETSGFSAIFPPGLTVGQIVGVYNSADGLSYRLKVKLSTDFSTLRNVSVITAYNAEERIRLNSEATDSLLGTKLR